MEHVKNFANLAEILSAKFHLSKSEVSLYLLALIQRSFKNLDPHIVTFATNSNHLVESGVLDWDTLRSIEDSGFINFETFDKDKLRKFSEYLITEYLKSVNIIFPSSDFLSFIANLATESSLELHSPDDYKTHLPPIIDSSESFNLNDKNDVGRLISLSFSHPNPNYRTDRDTEWSIYVANVGTGDVVIKLVEKLEKEGISKNCYVVGEEPDEILNFLTDFNYFTHNVCKNTQTNDNPLETISNHGIGLDDEIQIAISIPPFNNIPQQELQKLYKFVGSTEKIYFSELAYIELMLKRVSERGKVIAVVRNEFLSSRKSKVFREKYLKNDWVEKIIALPRDFVNYPIDISVIVFNKSKLEKGFVIFDGSEDKFEKTEIGIEEIFSNDADLRVSRYAAKEGKELATILSKYPPNEVKKIKDLIDWSISGYNYSPDNRIVEDSSENLPYVRVKDLSNSNKDFTLDVSKVERVISREKARKKTVIDFSAVLVSKIAPKLKPTLFNFAGQPIVIGSDVIALKVKEDINIDYFLTQLYSRLVQIQVEMMRSGTVINRISAQDFLNIQIILPPLDEQQREVSEIRDLIVEKLSAEERISDVEFDIVASINHSLKNKLAVINNDYDTLVRFLRRKERKKETIIFSDPISANAIGDDIDTIEVITSRLKTNLSDASKVFNNALKIQKQNLKKDVVDLVKFFKEEVKPLYAGKNFSIEVNVKSGLKLNVWLDKDAFKDVIENLIENAKSHGFVDDEKNYRIVFELSKLEDSDDVDRRTATQYARIIYKNDGKPFPKNFSFEDYKQFSNKAGRTQGTGIGGYVINKMVDLHDGKLNFITPSDDFTVEFEIILPLED